MHLIRDIEAKAKKEIRRSGKIASGEKIFLPKENDAASFSLRIFFTQLLEKRRDITFTDSFEEASLIISPLSLDDAAAKVFELVCEGKPDELLNVPMKKTYAPFVVIPNEEIILYAEFFGWKKNCEKFSEKNFSSEVKIFLKNFSGDHPSTLYALKNVRDELPKIYQERCAHEMQ